MQSGGFNKTHGNLIVHKAANPNRAAQDATPQQLEDFKSMLFLRPEYFKTHTTFKRCQDIDAKYIAKGWELDPATAVIFVSHPWLTPQNPDPKGEKFTLVAGLLERLPLLMSNQEDLRHVEDVCVWFDFSCLPQHPRSAKDEDLFRKGLGCLSFLQSECTTLIIRCDKDNYEHRGWCFMEATTSLTSGRLLGWVPLNPSKKRELSDTFDAWLNKQLDFFGDVLGMETANRDGTTSLTYNKKKEIKRDQVDAILKQNDCVCTNGKDVDKVAQIMMETCNLNANDQRRRNAGQYSLMDACRKSCNRLTGSGSWCLLDIPTKKRDPPTRAYVKRTPKDPNAVDPATVKLIEKMVAEQQRKEWEAKMVAQGLNPKDVDMLMAAVNAAKK